MTSGNKLELPPPHLPCKTRAEHSLNQSIRYHVGIDKEGYFHLDGMRITDVAFSQSLIEHMQRTTEGALVTQCEGEVCIVDYELAPLMVQDITPVGILLDASPLNTWWELTCNYGVKVLAPSSCFYWDAFSRLRTRGFVGELKKQLAEFCKNNAQGNSSPLTLSLAGQHKEHWAWLKTSLPVVWERQAQQQWISKAPEPVVNWLKNLPSTAAQQEWPWVSPVLKSLPSSTSVMTATRQAQSWQDYYEQTPQIAWDQNNFSPELPHLYSLLPKEAARGPQTLGVLGSGQGYDYHWLKNKKQAQDLVWAIDFVDFKTLQSKSPLLQAEDLPFHLQLDVLTLAQQKPAFFDVLWEYTCLAALPPYLQTSYWQNIQAALKSKGHLLGTFFVHDALLGPPFGITPLDLQLMILPYFEIRYWQRSQRSIGARQFLELSVILQKKT